MPPENFFVVCQLDAVRGVDTLLFVVVAKCTGAGLISQTNDSSKREYSQLLASFMVSRTNRHWNYVLSYMFLPIGYEALIATVAISS